MSCVPTFAVNAIFVPSGEKCGVNLLPPWKIADGSVDPSGVRVSEEIGPGRDRVGDGSAVQRSRKEDVATARIVRAGERFHVPGDPAGRERGCTLLRQRREATDVRGQLGSSL